MEDKLKLVQCLFNNLNQNMKEHMKKKQNHQTKYSWGNGSYMDKNCGKHALKRQIIMLRPELLNLERLLDGEVL